MRYTSFIRRARVSSGSLLVTTLILAGCSSTKVVHRDLDAIGIQQINELCEYDCFATVSHFDSLYSKLRMKDVYVTLSHIESGVLTLGTGASWPVSDLDEIAIRVPGPRNGGRGLLVGLGMGVLAGFAIGAVITRADEQPFLEGIVFGAPVGGLVGLFVGGAIGTRSVTVYRYRPDTPRQMSVLVGVGPSMTQ